MLQREHSAILCTFIKLPIVNKIFVLSIFEWLFYTGFTVLVHWTQLCNLISTSVLDKNKGCNIIAFFVIIHELPIIADPNQEARNE